MYHRRRISTVDGGSLQDRLGVFCIFCALSLVLLLGLIWSDVQAQPPEPKEPPPTPEQAPARKDHLIHFEKADRDSLVVEIHRYTEMISAMRDSLSLSELGLGIELAPEDRTKIENSIQDFTLLIEKIGTELGSMDLEIVDNQISLLDAEGEGIVINIPENLDEQLSEGLNVLSKMILSELPDSVQFDSGGQWGWQGVELKPFGRKEKRKVIKGNIVKVWDRLQVSSKEDVRGHVVVVFGDAEVAGRVDGNVVVVFGDLQLTENAEVTGEVIAIGGRLDQDPDADVADVVVVDPWSRLGSGGPESIFNPGPMNFILGQGEFLAMLLFSVLAFSLSPARRLQNSIKTLVSRPGPSLAAGLLSSFGLHVLALVVMGILVLTVIGIPVALLVGMALVLLGVLSVGLAAQIVGRRICRGVSGNCGSTWVAVILGLVVIHSVSFLGQLLGMWGAFSTVSRILVGIGFFLKALAYLFGLGALVLSRFGANGASPPVSD